MIDSSGTSPATPAPAAPAATTPSRPAFPFGAHLAAVRTAADALLADAAAAGLDASVPTCPGWRVANVVAHQGMVHRWTTANLRLDPTPVPTEAEILATVPHADLLAWFAAGITEMAAAFAAADPDVAALVFLDDAPPPRDFWARRQAHETGMHAVDVLAARLGRRPTAVEAAIPRDLALDGLDELLTGFVTRGRNGLCDAEATSIAVVPDDALPAAPLAWFLEVLPEGIRTMRTTPERTPAADAVFRGTAAQLHLGLWNRGDEVRVDGRADLLARWAERVQITWG
ncbi:maleylpyruvate isomerase N-terminal domain-containing protein [Actinotalea fermentans]|uniref:Mycothiol-dependent maleylpyruvate isomerase metal-binding domain-containing protein n=1 Tax=Actinotalea fermentans TaxID=43671 RepID=A0A511Z0Q3_9CELL|nr:maleylpyruvate isomerase N-terminal domain-containing protein [Actinotalea fermentans]GEN81012.1 hypothetical protein AFE02nite_27460 [Actinotalea fermentans]